MSFTVFLGNLPVWVTADDIKQWLSAEDLVADSVKVIRNHETQESKGFAFVEAPTVDEMQAIIRRFVDDTKIKQIMEEPAVPIDYRKVPWCIYSHPEVAFSGLTEDAAKQAGLEVVVQKDAFGGNGRARILGETEGLVKVVAERGPARIRSLRVIGLGSAWEDGSK